MSKQFMIYGASGYTGKLIARMAKNWKLNPILAGRNKEKIKSIADELGFEYRVFSLTDVVQMDEALKDVDVVIHTAGPFSATAMAMLDACLRTGSHYLDITGEIDVFEALARRSAEAGEKGIMVLPGAGYDVVPSDCLAAHVVRRLPHANKLTLALSGLDKPSRGTAKTALENLDTASRIRKNGQIVKLPIGSLTRHFDFGEGLKRSVAIGWGDVSTAYYSTGIENIEVYFRADRVLNTMTIIGKYLGWLLRTSPLQHILKAIIAKQPEGPTDEQRAAGVTTIIAAAEDAAGRRVTSKLNTPGSYTLTCLTVLTIVSKVLEGEFQTGFQTPSLVYGPDFILNIEGVKREDLTD